MLNFRASRKMVYRRYFVLRVFAFLMILENAVSARFTDYPYFAGLNITQNLRKGNYNLSKGFEQSVRRNNMVSAGVLVGKKYSLFSNLRLQVPFMFDYGVVPEDTLKDVFLSNGGTEDLLLNSTFYHVGFTPQIQYCMPVTVKGQFYLSGGGGVHYSKIKEKEHVVDQPKVRIINDNLIEEKTFCFSADAGAGFEVMLRKFVWAFQYTFRYWKPVKYKFSKDLFPLYNVDYSEHFFSHNFQILVFIRGVQ